MRSLHMLTDSVQTGHPGRARAMIRQRRRKGEEGQAAAREALLKAAASKHGMRPISSSLFRRALAAVKKSRFALVSRDSSPSNWAASHMELDRIISFIGGPAARASVRLTVSGCADFAAPRRDSAVCHHIPKTAIHYAPGPYGRRRIIRLPMLTLMWKQSAYHRDLHLHA